MELILLKDIENLGSKFDVVSVKPGYGRNFLIPKGFAKIANVSNMKHLEEIKKQQSSKLAKLMEEWQAVAEKMKATKITVGAKAGATGKLFGSVTNIQLADAIHKQMDIKIERKKIHILGEVKELGLYKANVNLFKEISTEIDFEVVGE